jgi:hypothetical protein
MPSRDGSPPAKPAGSPRDLLDGSPGRVPMPSRALAPAGIARLRLRDHGNPRRVGRSALRPPTATPTPLASLGLAMPSCPPRV